MTARHYILRTTVRKLASHCEDTINVFEEPAHRAGSAKLTAANVRIWPISAIREIPLLVAVRCRFTNQASAKKRESDCESASNSNVTRRTRLRS